MMAFSGVRSSWLMFARNSLFARLASTARSFSASYFRARSESCVRLASSRPTASRRASSSRLLSASRSFSAVISTAVITSPPVGVRRSWIWAQRPSRNSTSRIPAAAPSGFRDWRIVCRVSRAKSECGASGLRASPSIPNMRAKARLAATRRPSASQQAKAEAMTCRASTRDSGGASPLGPGGGSPARPRAPRRPSQSPPAPVRAPRGPAISITSGRAAAEGRARAPAKAARPIPATPAPARPSPTGAVSAGRGVGLAKSLAADTVDAPGAEARMALRLTS